MTDAAALLKLADAVEAGERIPVYSWEELHDRFGDDFIPGPPGTPKGRMLSDAQHSLDAGLALMRALLGEGWAWQIDRDSARFYRSMGGKLEGVEGYSDGQPARALLAAVLRARAAEMEGG